MAIKKGAFEIYAQERQLPNKDIKSKQLKSPFFENLDNALQTVHIKTEKTELAPINSSTNNGSQTVHKRFTDAEEVTSMYQEKQEILSFNHEQKNGSQTVHRKTDKTGAYPADSSTNNGSQTVHKRFTDAEEVTSKHQEKQEISSFNHEQSNGSQTVHKRFTDIEETTLKHQENQWISSFNHEQNNDSQTVHTKTDKTGEFPVNSSANNGSQTVHKRFTDTEELTSKHQEKQEISSFNHEQKNGSQTVHRKTDKTGACPADSSTNNGSQTVHKRFTGAEEVTSRHQEKQEISSFNHEQNNGSQTVHTKTDKTELDQVIKFSKLGGIQRDVIVAFYKCIQLNDLYTTKELTLDEISILAGVNKKSLKNTLFRLASTGYIIRAEQKIGRGGWVKYSLNSCLSEELNNIGVVYGLKKR